MRHYKKDLHKEVTIEECNVETSVYQWFGGRSGVMPAGLNQGRKSEKNKGN